MRTLLRVNFPDGIRYVIQDGDRVLAIYPPVGSWVDPSLDERYRQRAMQVSKFRKLSMPRYKGFAEKGAEAILFNDMLWRNGDALEVYERLLELEGKARQVAWREFFEERYGKRYQRVRDTEGVSGTGDSQDGGLSESGEECPD